MQIINFYQNKNKKVFDHTRAQMLVYLFILMLWPRKILRQMKMILKLYKT